MACRVLWIAMVWAAFAGGNLSLHLAAADDPRPFLDSLFSKDGGGREPELPASYVGCPLELDSSGFASFLDRYVPWVIKSDENANLSFTAHRIAPVELSVENGTTRFRITTTYSYRVASFAIKFPAIPRIGWHDDNGRRLPIEKRPGFRITIQGRIVVENFAQIRLILENVELNPTQSAKIGLLFWDIDLTSIIQGIARDAIFSRVSDKFVELSSKLSSVLKDYRDDHVHPLMRDLGQGWPLGDHRELRLNPVDLEIQHPVFAEEGKVLQTAIGLTFRPEINFKKGAEPPKVVDDAKSIPIRIQETVGQGVKLMMPAFASLSFIEGGLKDVFGRHHFNLPSQPNRKLVLESPIAVFAGQRLALKIPLKITGEKEQTGAMYVAGVPGYSANPSKFLLTDIATELHSAPLVKPSLSPFKDRLDQMVKLGWEFPIENDRKTVANFWGLVNRRVDREGLKFTWSTVGDFGLHDIRAFPSRDAVGFILRATGKLKAEFQRPLFPTSPRMIRSIRLHYDIYNENKDEEGGLTIHLRRPDVVGAPQVQITPTNWSLGQLWKDYTIHSIMVENTKEMVRWPLAGDYVIDVDITAGERIDHFSEVYLEIMDDTGGTTLAPASLWYQEWRNNQKHDSVSFKVPGS